MIDDQTYICPSNLVYAFSLDTFQQRSQHDPLMETTVSQIRGRGTILHRVNDLFDVCDLDYAGMSRTDELNSTSITADGKVQFFVCQGKITCLQTSSILLASPLTPETFMATNFTASGLKTSAATSSLRPSFALSSRA
jgi:hypothetical protein